MNAPATPSPQSTLVALRRRVNVANDGSISIPGLPLRAGQSVEVILLAEEPASPRPRFPLPGPFRFDDPISPVGLEDWELLKP